MHDGNFLMGQSRLLFLYFRLFYIIQLTDKKFPTLEFELRISGVGSNRSAKKATSTPLHEGSLMRSFRFNNKNKTHIGYLKFCAYFETYLSVFSQLFFSEYNIAFLSQESGSIAAMPYTDSN